MNLLLIGYGKVGKRYFSILEKKKNTKVIILRKKKFISKKFTNRIPNLKKISAAIICKLGYFFGFSLMSTKFS